MCQTSSPLSHTYLLTCFQDRLARCPDAHLAPILQLNLLLTPSVILVASLERQ